MAGVEQVVAAPRADTRYPLLQPIVDLIYGTLYVTSAGLVGAPASAPPPQSANKPEGMTSVVRHLMRAVGEGIAQTLLNGVVHRAGSVTSVGAKLQAFQSSEQPFLKKLQTLLTQVSQLPSPNRPGTPDDFDDLQTNLLPLIELTRLLDEGLEQRLTLEGVQNRIHALSASLSQPAVRATLSDTYVEVALGTLGHVSRFVLDLQGWQMPSNVQDLGYERYVAALGSSQLLSAALPADYRWILQSFDLLGSLVAACRHQADAPATSSSASAPFKTGVRMLRLIAASPFAEHVSASLINALKPVNALGLKDAPPPSASVAQSTQWSAHTLSGSGLDHIRTLLPAAQWLGLETAMAALAATGTVFTQLDRYPEEGSLLEKMGWGAEVMMTPEVSGFIKLLFVGGPLQAMVQVFEVLHGTPLPASKTPGAMLEWGQSLMGDKKNTDFAQQLDASAQPLTELMSWAPTVMRLGGVLNSRNAQAPATTQLWDLSWGLAGLLSDKVREDPRLLLRATGDAPWLWAVLSAYKLYQQWDTLQSPGEVVNWLYDELARDFAGSAGLLGQTLNMVGHIKHGYQIWGRWKNGDGLAPAEDYLQNLMRLFKLWYGPGELTEHLLDLLPLAPALYRAALVEDASGTAGHYAQRLELFVTAVSASDSPLLKSTSEQVQSYIVQTLTAPLAAAMPTGQALFSLPGAQASPLTAMAPGKPPLRFTPLDSHTGVRDAGIAGVSGLMALFMLGFAVKVWRDGRHLARESDVQTGDRELETFREGGPASEVTELIVRTRQYIPVNLTRMTMGPSPAIEHQAPLIAPHRYPAPDPEPARTPHGNRTALWSTLGAAGLLLGTAGVFGWRAMHGPDQKKALEERLYARRFGGRPETFLDVIERAVRDKIGRASQDLVYDTPGMLEAVVRQVLSEREEPLRLSFRSADEQVRKPAPIPGRTLAERMEATPDELVPATVRALTQLRHYTRLVDAQQQLIDDNATTVSHSAFDPLEYAREQGQQIFDELGIAEPFDTQAEVKVQYVSWSDDPLDYLYDIFALPAIFVYKQARGQPVADIKPKTAQQRKTATLTLGQLIMGRVKREVGYNSLRLTYFGNPHPVTVYQRLADADITPSYNARVNTFFKYHHHMMEPVYLRSMRARLQAVYQARPGYAPHARLASGDAQLYDMEVMRHWAGFRLVSEPLSNVVNYVDREHLIDDVIFLQSGHKFRGGMESGQSRIIVPSLESAVEVMRSMPLDVDDSAKNREVVGRLRAAHFTHALQALDDQDKGIGASKYRKKPLPYSRADIDHLRAVRSTYGDAAAFSSGPVLKRLKPTTLKEQYEKSVTMLQRHALKSMDMQSDSASEISILTQLHHQEFAAGLLSTGISVGALFVAPVASARMALAALGITVLTSTGIEMVRVAMSDNQQDQRTHIKSWVSTMAIEAAAVLLSKIAGPLTKPLKAAIRGAVKRSLEKTLDVLAIAKNSDFVTELTELDWEVQVWPKVEALDRQTFDLPRELNPQPEANIPGVSTDVADSARPDTDESEEQPAEPRMPILQPRSPWTVHPLADDWIEERLHELHLQQKDISGDTPIWVSFQTNEPGGDSHVTGEWHPLRSVVTQGFIPAHTSAISEQAIGHSRLRIHWADALISADLITAFNTGVPPQYRSVERGLMQHKPWTLATGLQVDALKRALALTPQELEALDVDNDLVKAVITEKGWTRIEYYRLRHYLHRLPGWKRHPQTLPQFMYPARYPASLKHKLAGDLPDSLFAYEAEARAYLADVYNYYNITPPISGSADSQGMVIYGHRVQPGAGISSVAERDVELQDMINRRLSWQFSQAGNSAPATLIRQFPSSLPPQVAEILLQGIPEGYRPGDFTRKQVLAELGRIFGVTLSGRETVTVLVSPGKPTQRKVTTSLHQFINAQRWRNTSSMEAQVTSWGIRTNSATTRHLNGRPSPGMRDYVYAPDFKARYNAGEAAALRAMAIDDSRHRPEP